MPTTCCSCHAQVPSDSTYFSAIGEVCGPCHAKGEAHDAARFAEGARDSAAFAAGDFALSTGRSGGFQLFIGPVDVWPVFRSVFRGVAGVFRTLVSR